MRRAPCLTLLAVLCAGPPARAEEREVMLFRPAAGGFSLDDLRLADAIRIHTRDVTTGEPGAKNRLTVWYEGSRDKGQLVTVTLYVQPPGQEDRGQVVKVSVRGRLDDSLYRALALKVRAALVGDPRLPRVPQPPSRLVPSPDLVATSPAPASAAPPPTPTPPAPPTAASRLPAPEAPVARSTSPAPPSSPAAPPRSDDGRREAMVPQLPPTPTRRLESSPRPTASQGVADALRRTRPQGLAVEVGPRLVLSDGSTGARAGGQLVVAWALGPIYEITVGAALDQAHAAAGPQGRAEARVWPVFSSLRLLHRGARLTFGGGPRVGVAIVSAAAFQTPDAGGERQLGVATRATATLGGETLVRYRLWRGLQLVAALSLDIHLTDVVVRLDLTPTLDAARVTAGGTLSLAYTYP